RRNGTGEDYLPLDAACGARIRRTQKSEEQRSQSFCESHSVHQYPYATSNYTNSAGSFPHGEYGVRPQAHGGKLDCFGRRWMLSWCPEEDSNLHSVATART